MKVTKEMVGKRVLCVFKKKQALIDNFNVTEVKIIRMTEAGFVNVIMNPDSTPSSQWWPPGVIDVREVLE